MANIADVMQSSPAEQGDSPGAGFNAGAQSLAAQATESCQLGIAQFLAYTALCVCWVYVVIHTLSPTAQVMQGGIMGAICGDHYCMHYL